MRAISPRAPCQRGFRLREADEAVGAQRGHVPVHRALDHVRRAGLQGRARLTGAGGEGEERDRGAGAGGLPRRVAQRAAALVVHGQVGVAIRKT